MFFSAKVDFLFLALSLCCYWPPVGRAGMVGPETARRDALATRQRPKSIVFLVKEEEGIVRKYKTSPSKKKSINAQTKQPSTSDDCRAINISR